MRKILLSLCVLAAGLLSAGCHDEIIQKIDELEDRVDDMTLMCNRLNENLSTLRNLVEVIQRQDMITGITEIRSGSTVTGYRINFVQHEPITISNGSDGKKPLIASRQNPDDKNYYWAVQYGDDAWDWLRAADGSMMLSIGVLPYVTERNGVFQYTFDGVNWIELGKADGVNGDQMFEKVTPYSDYVLFHMTTGEIFKIPTYSAFLSLKTEFDKANDHVDAQIALVQATQNRLTWITSIDPILDGADTTGLTVALSNGKQFSIHDWTSTLSPAIFVKRANDGHLYWAYTIGLSEEKWVLSPEGKRISAESESVETPLVSVARDEDGDFYWVVITQDSTEFLRTKVDDKWQPHAVDSVKSIFTSVKDYSDSLVVVLKDSTRFVLPKEYTVSFSDADGNPIGDRFAMKENSQAVIRYTVNGSNPSLTLLAQGGLTATASTMEGGDPCIVVRSPYHIMEGQGKIVAVFTFPGTVSPITLVKTITVTKE
jgi:hypothetical protein